MNARDRIMERVRAAVTTLRSPQPLPEYALDVATARAAAASTTTAARVAEFVARLQSVRGRAYTDMAALATWLAAEGATRGVCDPRLLALFESGLGSAFALETVVDRSRVDDYRFGVTRAAGAIAETGTVILTDAGTFSRLAALTPFIHIAVLGPTDVYSTVAEAVGALGADPNVIWCTGPSKTADVEGILIEGVHGPGEQVVLIL